MRRIERILLPDVPEYVESDLIEGGVNVERLAS
jgi:hypothetical protein